MAATPPAGYFQFRRAFLLLLLLVVVPSAGLSGFGVLAIINERAAVEKRVEANWSGRLEILERRFLGALQTADRGELETGLHLETRDGRTLSREGFRVNKGEVASSDPRLRAIVGTITPELSALEGTAAFSVPVSDGAVILVAEKRGQQIVGARLDDGALQALLSDLGRDLHTTGEAVRYELRPPKREVREGLLNKLVSEVQQAREAALGGPPPLAERQLPEPLQDYTLVARPVGEDPVASVSTRNRTLYVILLILFYGTLAAGVAYTARALYKEAKISRLKTDFVSLVSHELRTPLTSIRMFIEMMAQHRVEDPAEQQRVLEMLSRETARLSSMIERVLDWSRIESGRKVYEPQRTQVALLVDHTLEAFEAQRLGQQYELRREVEDGLPEVDVDREALAGAVLNLLQNAFKYSGEDKKIALRARRDGRGVAIEVEDNGFGIPPRERKRIFDRFYRVDNLLSRKTEGSGLGLAIAKRIIEAQGGHITVTSEVGKGSCFTIHLPSAKHAPAEEEARA